MFKMDDFIKKQLEDRSVDSSDQWNVPSESHWNTAKEHFPKKKENRRRALWLWTLGVCALFLVGFYFLKLGTSDTKAIINKTQEIAEAETTQVQTVTTKETETNQIIITSNEEQIAKEQEIVSTPIVTAKKIQAADNINKTAIENNATFGKSTPFVQNTLKPIVGNNPSNAPMTKDVARINTEVLNTTTISKNKTSSPVLEKRELVTNFPTLISPKIYTVDTDTPKNLKTPSIAIIPVVPSGSFYEFGVSHKQFGFTLLSTSFLIDEDQELGTLVELDRSYRNANLNFNKHFNKKWSLSTGLDFSKLGLNIDACIITTLTNEDLDIIVGDGIDGAIATRGGLSDDLEIELIDGIELAEGDQIKVKGNIDLNIRAIELPILFNLHLNKSKFEFVFGGGLALEYLRVEQQEAEFFIFLDNTLINKETVQDSFLENIFDSSFYLNYTTKYHINKNLNCGLSKSINLSDIGFSYIEAGLYYRFY